MLSDLVFDLAFNVSEVSGLRALPGTSGLSIRVVGARIEVVLLDVLGAIVLCLGLRLGESFGDHVGATRWGVLHDDSLGVLLLRSSSLLVVARVFLPPLI